MPFSLNFEYDSGWTDGCPGPGRLRLEHPQPLEAEHMCLSIVDRRGAQVADLLATFDTGDVVTILRPGHGARAVVWIMGGSIHRGDYYRIPIRVRAVSGSFAAEDVIDLVHVEDGAQAPQEFVAQPTTEDAPQDEAEILRARLTQTEAELRILLDDDTPVLIEGED